EPGHKRGSSASTAPTRRTRRARLRRPHPLLRDVGPYFPEPPAQWHRPEVLETFAAAVEKEFSGKPRQIDAMVGTSRLPSDASLLSVDPADPTSLVAVSASCGPDQVAQAVGVAVQVAEEWRRRPAAERARVLLRAADGLRRRRLEIAALEVHEVGKDWADADADVCEAIDYCEYYARSMLILEAGGAGGA
ncbi:MAG TPA: hypothetical protein DCQ30_01570, partial [Acidimicrobiaceae bacterium]|nr:hypothetical protein [Acidimicrobiaceae bacterium]